jgi:hypothetical protein
MADGSFSASVEAFTGYWLVGLAIGVVLLFVKVDKRPTHISNTIVVVAWLIIVGSWWNVPWMSQRQIAVRVYFAVGFAGISAAILYFVAWKRTRPIWAAIVVTPNRFRLHTGTLAQVTQVSVTNTGTIPLFGAHVVFKADQPNVEVPLQPDRDSSAPADTSRSEAQHQRQVLAL